MALTYTTRAGDTFDILALDFYNDEYKANLLIEANPAYRKVLVFPAGVRLQVPRHEQTAATTLPPWKR